MNIIHLLCFFYPFFGAFLCTFPGENALLASGFRFVGDYNSPAFLKSALLDIESAQNHLFMLHNFPLKISTHCFHIIFRFFSPLSAYFLHLLPFLTFFVFFVGNFALLNPISTKLLKKTLFFIFSLTLPLCYIIIKLPRI